MKLPALPLRRDPRAAMARARQDLNAAEAELSKLAMQRGKALIGTDEIDVDAGTSILTDKWLDVVAGIDASIDQQHKAIAALTDRCAALAQQVWQQDYERREAERTAAIAKLEVAFQKRVAIAADLEKAVQHMGDLWLQLLDSREPCLASWPDELFPRPPAEVLRSRQMERELSYLLFACSGTVFGVSRLPAPINPPGVQGLSPEGLIGVVNKECNSILENLRNAPLPTEIDEEVAA